jgi:hypothetical protein
LSWWLATEPEFVNVFKEPRNRFQGIKFRLHRLAGSIPWNRFLVSLKVNNTVSVQAYFIVFQSFKSEGESNPMPNAVESIMSIFLFTLGTVYFQTLRIKI